jgi:hypothetical protein
VETHGHREEQIVHSERPGFPTSETVQVVALSHRLRPAREGGTESRSPDCHRRSHIRFAVRVRKVVHCGTRGGGEIRATAQHGTLQRRIVEVSQNIVVNGMEANGHARRDKRTKGVALENRSSGQASRKLTHAVPQISTSLAGVRQAPSACLGDMQQRCSTSLTVGNEQRLELLKPVGSEAMQDAA